ncbi:MAG: exo-beta-N-acetylmuramidase NamZ family protein [Bacteroidota bacterium]
MKKYKIYITILSVLFALTASAQGIIPIENTIKTIDDVKVGADRTSEYLPLLKGKSVAIVANQSSKIKKTHLVDSLLSLKVNIKKIFCPEHGFRGLVDAGEHVKTYKDDKTGLTIISLYGKNNKKPFAEDLKDVDVVVFDIQDVGVRFYTYLSTLHYVMEACAENKKQLIVLDRPNPNGYYIDGPVMEDNYKSFLGLHTVPVVYGMTIGEYAQMINGEGWLKAGVKCNLKIIPVLTYDHKDLYELPVRPSPNLPNMSSVYLYPSLGLFEGTIVSVGRGTDLPFQVIGHPTLQKGNYSFTPQPKLGAAEPKYKGQACNGYNLSDFGYVYMKDTRKLYLFWLMGMYANTPDKTNFFDENFNYHAGNAMLQQQIKDGVPEEKIRATWQDEIKKFKIIRKKYLLYKDFE